MKTSLTVAIFASLLFVTALVGCTTENTTNQPTQAEIDAEAAALETSYGSEDGEDSYGNVAPQ